MRTYNLAMEEQGELDGWNAGEYVRSEDVKEELSDLKSLLYDKEEIIASQECEIDELRAEVVDLQHQLKEAQDYE